ncbi:N-acetyltransferase [Candidatus Pacearchaeota archaeon]|nr:N-acetyltransferase [Candidatus Pacearchaeota archaeon]
MTTEKLNELKKRIDEHFKNELNIMSDILEHLTSDECGVLTEYMGNHPHRPDQIPELMKKHGRDTMKEGNCNTIEDCSIGENVTIWNFCNLYNSTIGDGTRIGSYTEIGGSKIGKNCLIQAYVFIPPGITIDDYVFIGPGVRFSNDSHPPSGLNPAQRTHVSKGVSIGMGCLIAPGIYIGEGAKIRMGSMVVRDVKPGEYYRGE